MTRALAENINQEALPGDQVSGRSLVDKVRNQEGKRKIDNVNNRTRYGGDNCNYSSLPAYAGFDGTRKQRPKQGQYLFVLMVPQGHHIKYTLAKNVLSI